jgi:hypothetical protein
MVNSTQGTSYQRRFFPNPIISLLILDELKNLGFEERGEIHEIKGARAMDSLQGWRSFSLIPSMDLGVKMSLIIYLQPWSEFMALAPSISWISPHSLKT